MTMTLASQSERMTPLVWSEKTSSMGDRAEESTTSPEASSWHTVFGNDL